ncbi:MAG: hypothetical protein NT034_04460 [Candidatus Magasanikbacteria bacterium]|nr:hypothetical protein [Candidatus Magasanikbacteria bacterium]
MRHSHPLRSGLIKAGWIVAILSAILILCSAPGLFGLYPQAGRVMGEVGLVGVLAGAGLLLRLFSAGKTSSQSMNFEFVNQAALPLKDVERPTREQFRASLRRAVGHFEDQHPFVHHLARRIGEHCHHKYGKVFVLKGHKTMGELVDYLYERVHP